MTKSCSCLTLEQFYLRDIKQTYRDQMESNKHNKNHPEGWFCLHIKEQEREKRFAYSELGCRGSLCQ